MGARQRKRNKSLGGSTQEIARLPALELRIAGIDGPEPIPGLIKPDAVALAEHRTGWLDRMEMSIRANGVLEPVLIRWIEDEPWVLDGRKRIVYGRAVARSMVASGELADARMFLVPTTEHASINPGLAARHANLMRAEPSILEQCQYAAEAAAILSDEDGAREMGITVARFRNLKTVHADACDEVKAALMAGKVTLRTAAQAARSGGTLEQRAWLTAKRPPRKKIRAPGVAMRRRALERMREQPWWTEREHNLMKVMAGHVDYRTAKDVQVAALFCDPREETNDG